MVIQIVAVASKYRVLLLNADARLLCDLDSKDIEILLVNQLEFVCQGFFFATEDLCVSVRCY